MRITLMLIARTSCYSGILRQEDLPITEEQYYRWVKGNEPILEIMPHLTSSQREFLISGMTDEEWDECFGGDEFDREEENHFYLEFS